MKIISRGPIALALVVLSTPLIHGQDLSKYRTFSLGMTLADVSKQIDAKPADVAAIHEHPALIQQLAGWLPQPHNSASYPMESASRVLFSFDNGTLYRILVTYDSSAIKGLTADDMVQGISTTYGTATKPVAEINFPTNASYEDKSEKVIARWEDSQYSLNLVRLSSQDTFAIVMLSKQADAQAALSVAESVKLERQEAPQKEAAKVKKDADELEGERQKNIKTFRP
jgi:hypothetical protein